MMACPDGYWWEIKPGYWSKACILNVNTHHTLNITWAQIASYFVSLVGDQSDKYHNFVKLHSLCRKDPFSYEASVNV